MNLFRKNNGWANHVNGKDPSEYLKYAKTSTKELFKGFKSSPKGLTEHEAQERLKEYGLNEPAKRERASILKQIISKFLNPLIIILMVIVVFSIFFGEKISAIFVSCMILISVVLDFIQEFKSGKEVEKLNALVQTKVTVIRNGKPIELDKSELVPGDVVDLFAGDMIPADLRIFSSKDLFVNQASLTGESFPVEKTCAAISAKSQSTTEFTNLAFMGSSVVSGTAFGLVVRTGTSTQFGEISKKISGANVETSFDRGIRQFTMLMIRFIMVLVVAIFLVIWVFKHGSFKDALLFSLAVAVGLTPEMLPMMVTLNLSKGAVAMAKKRAIVKRLNSIQNFGAMDILCTDKTGTLTVDKIVLEKHCDIQGVEDEDVLRYAYIVASYQTGLKNVLDNAILNHEKMGVKQYKKVDEIPFDFIRRSMSVIVKNANSHMLICKGAPEEIFKKCNHFDMRGKISRLTPEILDKVIKGYHELSSDGFRVLAVAYKDISKKKSYSRDDESGMILKGYIGFLDPPKPSAKEVIAMLKDHKIEIKILTGDNELVTKRICTDVGLAVKGVKLGDDLENMGEEELRVIVESTTIFARLTPMQKERVIRALQANKHTVGYMGDGINDAPSLKIADVGISVNNGVDIAKESADIILLEKSLLVLHEGVEEGRKTFGNISKYIKMGSSSNFGNMAAMTGATVFLPFLPMLPLQILLNNFLYDLSQVTIPGDNVDEEYLTLPRPWNIDFIRKYMIFIGPLSSIFDFITYGVMWFIFGGSTLTPAAIALFQTGWFLESLCSQTLVIFIIRTNKIPFIQMLRIYIPP